jgi:hypothetical protein
MREIIKQIFDIYSDEGITGVGAAASRFLKWRFKRSQKKAVLTTRSLTFGQYYDKLYDKPVDQRELIHSLVAEDEFVLIVLDACRYDYFNRVYSEYLEGELRKTWSSGNRTPRWIPNTWSEKYDLTYIAGAPWMSDFKFGEKRFDYRPSEHFDTIVPVWRDHWDENRFTTDPKAITETSLNHLSFDEPSRLVVHCMQPHEPYIANESGNYADEPVTPLWKQGDHHENHPVDRITDNQKSLPRYSISEQIADGILTYSELRSMYEWNLRAVLGEVQQILKHIDPNTRTVITADHGELLGEKSFLDKKLIGHPDRTHWILREVPWFEVDPAMLKGETFDGEISSEPTTPPDDIEGVQKDRLRQLGYL